MGDFATESNCICPDIFHSNDAYCAAYMLERTRNQLSADPQPQEHFDIYGGDSRTGTESPYTATITLDTEAFQARIAELRSDMNVITLKMQKRTRIQRIFDLLDV